jgi:glycosyltransferase involved in cell wall biosynthesis
MMGRRIAARIVHAVAVAAAWPVARLGGRDDGVEVRFLLMHAWGMGGTIRSTLNLAGQLAQRHEVEILSVVRRRDEPHFPFPPGVRVTAIDDQRPGRRGRLAEALGRRHGRLLHPLDRASRASSLWTDVMLVRRLRRIRSGVVVGTRPSLNLLALDLAAPSVAIVGQEHMHLARRSQRMRTVIVRRYPGLDALVTLTAHDRNAYGAALRGSTPVVAIPNAVPAMAAVPSARSEPIVLGVGRLSPQKGFGRLIRAFVPVAAAHPEWRLRICGDGPLRASLHRLVRDLGLTERVALPGAVRGIEHEMARASVFALSSRFEGFPMVLLEAMSMGLAIVSFDCPTGPRELLDDGRSGMLVPEGDVDALAAALERVVADAELRGRLGRGAEAAAAAYSVDRVGERWDELLAGVLGPGQGAGGRRRSGARPFGWRGSGCLASGGTGRRSGSSPVTVTGSPWWTISSSSPASSS